MKKKTIEGTVFNKVRVERENMKCPKGLDRVYIHVLSIETYIFCCKIIVRHGIDCQNFAIIIL